MAGGAFWAGLAVLAALGGVALRVQFAQPLVPVLFGLAVLGVAVLRIAGGPAWPVLGLLILALGGWYLSLRPRDDRDWAPDMARIVTSEVSGSQATLHDVRNFRWQDRNHAGEAWETRRYDLDRLVSADMITSVWSSPLIAHLLVSFGFSDGQRVVFSVEIRRERGEAFSSIGGFFRQFELALIAADESDIVQLRTRHRGEDVRLYPLRLRPDQLRAMFLAYLDLGNRLAAQPAWYNTITSNCTTVVWQLARALKTDLPVHSSLLLSGRLPDWLHQMGLLQGEGDLAAIRAQAGISARARALPAGMDFSAWIRGETRPAPQ